MSQIRTSTPLKVMSLKTIVGTSLISAVLALSACSTPVDPDIKARQDIMKSYGDAMGIMGAMVKAPDTFDAALLKDQTSYLAEASQSPWVHFGNAESMGHATKPSGVIMQTSLLNQKNSSRSQQISIWLPKRLLASMTSNLHLVKLVQAVSHVILILKSKIVTSFSV